MAEWLAVQDENHHLRPAKSAAASAFFVLRALLAVLVGLCAAMVLILAPEIPSIGGVITWLSVGAVLLTCAWLLHDLLRAVGKRDAHGQLLRWLARLAVACVGAVLALVLVEGLLLMMQIRTDAPNRLVLPEAWQHRPVLVPGTHRAWFWHGELHLVWSAEWQFRRATGFAARDPETFRVMVVGDSLTFGIGVAQAATYPALLEKQLNQHYSAEVLNLGVCGVQSEEVLEVVQRWLPELQPDLVVYGICLNDFLDRGSGHEDRDDAWALPLPTRCKAFFTDRTLTALFLDRSYHRALITVGVRDDFHDQVSKDLERLAPRFTWDLLRINDVVTAAGGPPVIAMVLDQQPVEGGPGQALAIEAEEAALLSGMTVIPSMHYYHTENGSDLRVSAWEGHPNVEAHRLFAERLLPIVSSTPGLEKHRR